MWANHVTRLHEDQGQRLDISSLLAPCEHGIEIASLSGKAFAHWAISDQELEASYAPWSRHWVLCLLLDLCFVLSEVALTETSRLVRTFNLCVVRHHCGNKATFIQIWHTVQLLEYSRLLLLLGPLHWREQILLDIGQLSVGFDVIYFTVSFSLRPTFTCWLVKRLLFFFRQG